MVAFPEEITAGLGFEQIDPTEYQTQITTFLSEYPPDTFTLEQAYGLWQATAKYNYDSKNVENFTPVTMSQYLNARISEIMTSYTNAMTQQYTTILIGLSQLPENADLSRNQLVAKYPFHITS